MGFQELLQLVKDGEPVSAGVPNRPLRTLDDRTRYLYEVLQAAGVGATVFARGRTVDSLCTVGAPVYFNANTQRFERGLTAITTLDGALATADSAQIWGVVYSKSAADKADILLFGFAPLNITAALEAGEPLRAGSYYLSRTTPGKLTRLKPPVAVPVLKTDGNGNVFVSPQWSDLITSHSHLKFALRPLPAGVVSDPGDGNVHVISDPDPSIEGWLPADHAVFQGLAPSGAMFGYNLNENQALKDAWPPLPPEDAVLIQDGVEVSMGLGRQAIIDRNGIWWLSNCYGEVPWPTNLSTTLEQISTWSQSEDLDDPCFNYHMWIDLWFTRYGFLTEQTVVTSLTTKDDRVIITCEGTNTRAHVGALELSLNLSFLLGLTTDTGSRAFKTFHADTQKFDSGPVLSGIYKLSSNITLASDDVETRTIDGTPRTVYFGAVAITVDTSNDRELFVELVREDGVIEQYVNDVMYLGFPAGEQTSLRGRIHIPETLDLTSPTMTLKFRLLGRGAGTLPALTLTYRRIPKAATATALPTSDTSLTFTTGNAVTANQYIDVTSASFAVAAGDDVLFTLSRDSGDSYGSEVGVMRQVGLIAGS